jgi:plasmid stabilization system protein ParE
MTLRLRLTPRALTEAKRVQTWWRTERPKAPSLFEEELESTLARALDAPRLGVVYDRAALDVTVYRLLMPKTGHHVFYAVHGDELVVLSVWGAVKKAGPRLR